MAKSKKAEKNWRKKFAELYHNKWRFSSRGYLDPLEYFEKVLLSEKKRWVKETAILDKHGLFTKKPMLNQLEKANRRRK